MEVINVQLPQIIPKASKVSNINSEDFSKLLLESNGSEEKILSLNDKDEEDDQLLEMMVGSLSLNVQNETPHEPVAIETTIKQGTNLIDSKNNTIPTEELTKDFLLQSLGRFEKAEQSNMDYKNDLFDLAEENFFLELDALQNTSSLDMKVSKTGEKLVESDDIAGGKDVESVRQTNNITLENEKETSLKNVELFNKTFDIEKDDISPKLSTEAKAEITEEDIDLNQKGQIKIVNNISESTVEVSDIKLSSENTKKVNDTIIQLLETRKEGDTSVLKIKLYPENLGTVDVSVKREKGKLTANIMVDNEQIKEMFTKSIKELNESLLKQNIQIERINIDLKVKTNSSPMNQNFNNSQGESFNQNHSNMKKKTFGYYKHNNEALVPNEVDIYKSGELSILA